MKKALLGVLSTVIILSVCATTAFAAGPRFGRNFVDADGDGICDNAGSGCVYADADGDGLCDVCGAEHGSCLTGEGAAFVDADGDGICDNYGSGQGRGCGYGRGGPCGRGNGFRGGRGR